MLEKILKGKGGTDPSILSLNTKPMAISDQPIPKILAFPFNGRGEHFTRPLKVGDQIEAGTPLAKIDQHLAQPSPVKGKVLNIKHVPNVRGGKPQSAIFLAPDEDTDSKVFPSLNEESATVEALLERLEQAAITTGHPCPADLVKMLTGEEALQNLVVTLLDHEPEVCVSLQLFRDRNEDCIKAVKMLARISGTEKTKVAIVEDLQEEIQFIQSNNLEVLPVPARYPESLQTVISKKLGGGKHVFVSIETALAALDAVKDGRIPNKKVVTIIDVDGKAKTNVRVHLGASISDVLENTGVVPSDGDTIVVGGPFQGFSQYTMDGVIDHGVDALMVIPKKAVGAWSPDPCVNCGSCIDACPENLQVQLIGRYSEFGLYENTRELSLDQCTDCGLCAAACTVRRPLMQMISLAKKELFEADDCSEPENDDQKPGMFQDPSMALYSTSTRFTVGAAPFKRAKSSLAQMNYAFLWALLPVVLVSAIAFTGDSYVNNLGTSFGAIPGFVNTMLYHLGVGPGVLTMLGVFGVAALGMGTGVITEYISQILMRQPYQATNGHAALTGLLVAMLMPPNVPPLALILAVVIAIFIGKQIFGGIGGYPIHPAIVGWLIVYISWPHELTPIGTATIAASHVATVIVTLLGGLALWYQGYIRIRIPIAILAGVAIFTFAFQGNLNGGILDQILQGHVILAAFFLATDATVSPANKLAGWIYGLGIGFMIMLIRAFGIWPDAIPFAVMLMNILHPLLDRIRPKIVKEA